MNLRNLLREMREMDELDKQNNPKKENGQNNAKKSKNEVTPNSAKDLLIYYLGGVTTKQLDITRSPIYEFFEGVKNYFNK